VSPGEQLEAAAGTKFAVTLWLEFIVTLHGALPLHAPLHPLKVDPACAVAVSVTLAPVLYECVHGPGSPHTKPFPSLTLPEPVPEKFTVKPNPVCATPVRATDCMLPTAPSELSTNMMEAFFVPCDAGSNATLTMQ
jgi:hypothetical protein